MGRLQDEANRFRRLVNTRDTMTVDALVSRYEDVWNSLFLQARQLSLHIEDARRSGKKVSASWLYRQERYKAFLAQLGAEMEAASQYASEVVRAEVRRSIEEGQQHAFALLDTATGVQAGTWNRIPIEPLNELIAVTQPNSPISALFTVLPKQAQKAATSTLLAGLAEGLNPRQTARQLRKVTQYAGYRAATIARTETLRAYRTATHEIYRANDDVVIAWLWLASLSLRTCAVCIALHGKRFPLKVEMGTHPNCRCTQIPVTESDYSIPTGEEWFAEQPADSQEKILGKAKRQAYHDGLITLSDLIGEREDTEFGLTRYEKSLQEALKTHRGNE